MRLPRQTTNVVLALAAAASATIFARGQSLSEGFDEVSGLPSSGWVIVNNSTASEGDPTSVFQGNFNGGFDQPPPVFSAHSGERDSYAAMNYNSTRSGGTISTWLISPELEFANGDLFSFFSRTVSNPQYADRLEVRISYAGPSVNVGDTEESVGDFTNLLFTINEELTLTGYPSEWTEFGGAINGLDELTSGRIAFRYFVPNGGALGANSDYIGIDTLEYGRIVSSVPEASTVGGGLLLLGVLGWQGYRLRRSEPRRH